MGLGFGSTSQPGDAQGLQLVVADIEAAHDELARPRRRGERRPALPLGLVRVLQRPRRQRLGCPADPAAAVVEQPNILLIMTDEERYPPPYEVDARSPSSAATQLRRASGSATAGSSSTATTPARPRACRAGRPCSPASTRRCTACASTDGMAKKATDPAMTWLDPDSVPTMGDWFRAGGYHTHYRGKWHISHADLLIPGTHDSLWRHDSDGNVHPDAVEAYRTADRLDPFGFSGWIGREPHGADRPTPAACATGCSPSRSSSCSPSSPPPARRPVARRRVVRQPPRHRLRRRGLDSSSGFARPTTRCPDPRGALAERLVRRPPAVPGAVPRDVAADALRPAHRPRLPAPLPLPAQGGRPGDRPDPRRRSTRSGMADDTIVVFTSDHGDLLGAHGGLQQKWYNAYDEAIRVPLVVSGPRRRPRPGGITSRPATSTSSPRCSAWPASTSTARRARGRTPRRGPPAARPRPQPRSHAGCRADDARAVYFMTEDDISRGLHQANMFTGEPLRAGRVPVHKSSRWSPAPHRTPTGRRALEAQPLLRAARRLGRPRASPRIPSPGPAIEPTFFELHNLTADPEERQNLAGDDGVPLEELRTVLVDSAQPLAPSPHRHERVTASVRPSGSSRAAMSTAAPRRLPPSSDL